MALKDTQLAVLDLAEKHEAVREYFFRHAAGIEWFDELRARNLLRPEGNEAPYETEGGEGYVVPYWTALDYLVKTTKALQPGDQAAARKIADFVHEVADYSKTKGIDNYRTFYRLAETLADLPEGIVEAGDIERATEWLGSRFSNTLTATELIRLLGKLSSSENNNALVLRLLDAMTAFQVDKSNLAELAADKVKTVVEPYWLKELFSKHTDEIAAHVGQPVIELLCGRVRTISEHLGWNSKSHWWRRAIEDHEQDDYRDYAAESILVSATRDALIKWSKSGAGAVGFTQQLLHDSQSILRRLAIYALDRNFDELQELSAVVLSMEYFADEFRHELYHFLRNHYDSLSRTLKDVAIAEIERLAIEGDTPEQTEKWTSYQRLIWLHAIRDSRYEPAAIAYKKYLAIVGSDPDHPDFSAYSTSGFVVHKSPITPEALAELGPDEMVSFANAFNVPSSWGDVPDDDGLANAFEESAKTRPERFLGYLASLGKLRPRYAARILSGLRSAGSDAFQARLGETSSALEVLLFGETGQIGTQSPSACSWELDSVANEACRLLQVVLKRDDSSPADFDACRRVLVNIVERVPSRSKESPTDAVFDAINCAKGVAVETIFVYALRRRNSLKGTENEDHSWETIADPFSVQAARLSNQNYEFATMCGEYFPNLVYLGASWVGNNFDRLFSREFEFVWRGMHQGLSYSHGAYNPAFDILKERGEFVRALEVDFGKTHVHEYLVHQIGVQYLRGREELTGQASLMEFLLTKWNKEHVADLAQFMWQVRDVTEKEVRDRGVVLWKHLTRKALADAESNRSLLTRLAMLTTWIDELKDGDVVELLCQVALYAGEDHNEHFFLEGLKKLAEPFPSEVGTIMLAMTSRQLPTYEDDEIQEILRKLVNAGKRDVVREICNRYVRDSKEKIVAPIITLMQ